MDLVEQYKAYRHSAKALNEKIMETCVDRDGLWGVGDCLRILRENTFVLESQEELNALWDLAIYEWFRDGKNAVQLYRERAKEVSDIERELLDAYAASYTSLFRVVSTSPAERWLLLADLLNESRSVRLTDMNFSQTARRGLLFFTRIIPIGDLNMTSGVTFVFPGDKDNYLLAQYKRLRKKIKSESEAITRFVAFFKLNRTEGMEVRYE